MSGKRAKLARRFVSGMRQNMILLGWREDMIRASINGDWPPRKPGERRLYRRAFTWMLNNPPTAEERKAVHTRYPMDNAILGFLKPRSVGWTTMGVSG